MATISNEEFFTCYSALPRRLREAISSANATDLLYKIVVETEGLPIQNAASVANIINEILLGITRPEELETLLSKDVALRPDQARRIALAISEQILAPVLNDIQKLWEDRPREIAPSATPPRNDETKVAPAPSPDPYLPHKPKPIPKLEGQIVKLERTAPIIPPSPKPQAIRSTPPPTAPPRTPSSGPPATAPKASPPQNLPVATPKHNAGQEMTPYPSASDPYQPHKPRPVPKLDGNVVDLKRNTQFPISK